VSGLHGGYSGGRGVFRPEKSGQADQRDRRMSDSVPQERIGENMRDRTGRLQHQELEKGDPGEVAVRQGAGH